MRRTLSDPEARWEAIVFIDAAVTSLLQSGAVVAHGESEGWTDADVIAVEEHINARVDGAIRRNGAATRRRRRERK